jgi:hypothetical protein
MIRCLYLSTFQNELGETAWDCPVCQIRSSRVCRTVSRQIFPASLENVIKVSPRPCFALTIGVIVVWMIVKGVFFFSAE